MISPTMILVGVLGAFVLFGSGVMTGIKIESDRNKAQMLELERAMHEEYKKKIDAQRAISQEISKELNDATLAREQEAIAFADELRRSRESGKQLAVCAPAPRPVPVAKPVKLVMPYPTEPPPPQPVAPSPVPEPEPELTAVRLTAEFARLYDLALIPAGLPAPRDTGGAHAPVASSGSVDPETVLAVHSANADAWGDCRDRLAAWQTLARKHGWTK